MSFTTRTPDHMLLGGRDGKGIRHEWEENAHKILVATRERATSKIWSQTVVWY